MITGYIKVVGTATMKNRRNAEGESIAVPGFIKWQEPFFFDGRNPDSVKTAFEKAEQYAHSETGKMSIYGCPEMAGPWDDLPRVGQGIGDTN